MKFRLKPEMTVDKVLKTFEKSFAKLEKIETNKTAEIEELTVQEANIAARKAAVAGQAERAARVKTRLAELIK